MVQEDTNTAIGELIFCGQRLVKKQPKVNQMDEEKSCMD